MPVISLYESAAKRPRGASHERPSRFLGTVGRADAPEPPMAVQFEGLTDEQQRRAINSFPGGQRFVLASPHDQPRLLG